MGELIFFFIIPVIAFIFTTINYLLLKKYNLPHRYIYIIPIFTLPFSMFINIDLYLFVFFYISCSYCAYSYYQ